MVCSGKEALLGVQEVGMSPRQPWREGGIYHGYSGTLTVLQRWKGTFYQVAYWVPPYTVAGKGNKCT